MVICLLNLNMRLDLQKLINVTITEIHNVIATLGYCPDTVTIYIAIDGQVCFYR